MNFSIIRDPVLRAVYSIMFLFSYLGLRSVEIQLQGIWSHGKFPCYGR